MKKSDKPIYNYNYLKGEEAYIKCAECGAECLCHDGEYECSVCGNTGWTGEPMPEIDDAASPSSSASASEKGENGRKD